MSRQTGVRRTEPLPQQPVPTSSPKPPVSSPVRPGVRRTAVGQKLGTAGTDAQNQMSGICTHAHWLSFLKGLSVAAGLAGDKASSSTSGRRTPGRCRRLRGHRPRSPSRCPRRRPIRRRRPDHRQSPGAVRCRYRSAPKCCGLNGNQDSTCFTRVRGGGAERDDGAVGRHAYVCTGSEGRPFLVRWGQGHGESNPELLDAAALSQQLVPEGSAGVT